MNGRLAWLTIGLLILTGCQQSGGSIGSTSSSGVRLLSANVVNVPIREQQLVYERTKIPVEAVGSRVGKDFRIELQGHGQVFESEAYRLESDQFDLVDAAGETFSPPLPILKFPMTVGDSWTWEGKLESAGRTRSVTAKIMSSPDRIVLKDRTYPEIVKIEVQIQMDSGGATPATRILTFWIDRQDGVIKRQFGVGGSLRELRDSEGE